MRVIKLASLVKATVLMLVFVFFVSPIPAEAQGPESVCPNPGTSSYASCIDQLEEPYAICNAMTDDGERAACIQQVLEDYDGSNSSTACQAGGDILGFPTWWKYMSTERDPGGRCRPIINESKDLLPVGIAVLEIMLRLAGILAVTFITVGAFKYIISQGEPDKAKSAKGTIINSIIGLVITILASGIVSFIGNNIKAS